MFFSQDLNCPRLTSGRAKCWRYQRAVILRQMSPVALGHPLVIILYGPQRATLFSGSAAVGSIHSIVQPSRLSVADPSPRLGRKPWPHKQSLLFPLPQHRTTQICFLSLWTCLFCISQKWNQTPWGLFPSLSMLLSGSSAQSPLAHGSCLSLVGSLHPWPPLPPGVTHLSSLG